MGNLISGLFGGGGKKQAKAIRDSAEMQAKNDRLAAQAAQQGLESTVAQDKAARIAAETLSRPAEKIDVQLAPSVPEAEIDPTTGRRRTVRSSFTSKTASSGIKI